MDARALPKTSGREEEESALPSSRESALPSSRESALPSSRESALPSSRESAQPSLRESAAPTGSREESGQKQNKRTQQPFVFFEKLLSQDELRNEAAAAAAAAERNLGAQLDTRWEFFFIHRLANNFL